LDLFNLVLFCQFIRDYLTDLEIEFKDGRKNKQ